MDWSAPSESGSSEQFGNVSRANQIASDGRVELTLLRPPDIVESGFMAKKRDQQKMQG